MKTTTLPPLRVTPELRDQAESVLREGESLSAFILDAVNRSITHRRLQDEFIRRGLASAAEARATGEYHSAASVLATMKRKLATAKAKAKVTARSA